MAKEKHLDRTKKGQLIYDYKYDILTFKIKDRNYKMSLEFQNFVVDIDEENFISGIRIMDASQVSGLSKILLRNIVQGKFKASVKNNIITIRLEFVGKIRNKLLPAFSQEKDLIQFTTPGNSQHPLADSEIDIAPEIIAQ